MTFFLGLSLNKISVYGYMYICIYETPTFTNVIVVGVVDHLGGGGLKWCGGVHYLEFLISASA